MITCHILAGVGKEFTPSRAVRLARMRDVLERMGCNCVIHGVELCDPVRSDSYATQWGALDGRYGSFTDGLETQLSQSSGNSIIIATEPWHSSCFRGGLIASEGGYKGHPVVELRIYYPFSFANFRIFSTRFAMYDTARSQGTIWSWNGNWIAAQPYYAAGKKEMFQEKLHVCTQSYSVEHMDVLCKGVPVIAPDWGSWAETIDHKVTGMLYRSEEGKEAALRLPADAFRPETIIEAVSTRFNIDVAAAQIEPFLTRLVSRRAQLCI